MRLRRKHLVIAGAAALLGAAAFLMLRPESVDVETDVARREPLRVTVDAEGRTRVRDRYVVTAPVTGLVRRLALTEGSPVRTGEVVAAMAPPPLDATLYRQASARVTATRSLQREAELRLAQARLAHEDAGRALVRAERLAAAGALAARDREQAELARRVAEDDVRAAEARVRAAGAEVASAQAVLAPGDERGAAWTPVRSPVTGRVLRLPEQSERVVAAGTPILELGNAGALEVVVDILSADAVRVQPGAAVELHDWGGDAPLRARVRSVEPSAFTRVSALGVEEQRVDVVIDLVEPAPTLGDGFRVEVRIVTWEDSSALVVPASALVREERGWSVFTVEDGRARRRQVEIGQRGSATVQVRRGIEPGERVLLFPSDVIADGVRVRER